jgi:hypothetical protein
MFSRLPDAPGAATRRTLSFVLDGEVVSGREGDSVAAALLALGRSACRETVVSGALRGPFCMMGVCFDCLVVVDGIGSRQGCLLGLREGMRVETQRGRREVGR